jgi:hypothetical protein
VGEQVVERLREAGGEPSRVLFVVVDADEVGVDETQTDEWGNSTLS